MNKTAPSTLRDRTDRAAPWLCMVVHDYYPQDARVVREAKAAARAGYRVDVVCPTAEGQGKREAIDGICIHRIGISRNREAGILGLLGQYVRFAAQAAIMATRLRIRRRAASTHVVQVHAPPDFLILAGIVPKLLGSELILDIHDLSRHLFLARFADRPWAATANRILALIERAACTIADHVITVHEPYRNELRSNGVDPSRITVVMNAVDQELLARVAGSASNGAGSASNGAGSASNGAASLSNGSRGAALNGAGAPFTIAYHGSITPAYGVALIVEALPRVLESVPDLRCMILGVGDALGAARERAVELGLADVVEFSGRYLPIEEVLRTVGVANCGVIPNLPSDLNRFALSSKLLEYVALGVPAVVARLETLAKHFGPDEVTFFEPGDPGSFADAITWVAANPVEAWAKAERARARSREYSWTEHRARYLRVLPPTGAIAADESSELPRADPVNGDSASQPGDEVLAGADGDSRADRLAAVTLDRPRP